MLSINLITTAATTKFVSIALYIIIYYLRLSHYAVEY